jgi:hypothetical protein
MRIRKERKIIWKNQGIILLVVNFVIIQLNFLFEQEIEFSVLPYSSSYNKKNIKLLQIKLLNQLTKLYFTKCQHPK